MAPGEGEVGASGSTLINVSCSVGDLLNIDVMAADGVAKRVTAALRCR
ncbi:hypothetical protein ES707_14569 [subsurface metagenome]